MKVKKGFIFVIIICLLYYFCGVTLRIHAEQIVTKILGLEIEDVAALNYTSDVLMLIGSSIAFMLANLFFDFIKPDGITIFRCCFVLTFCTGLLIYLAYFCRNNVLEVIVVSAIGFSISGLTSAFEEVIKQ